jgi:hypothetical protein
MITYQVKHQVRTPFKNWLQIVYESPCERSASYAYDSMVRDHPHEYFEIVKLETIETCMEFTSRTEKG